MRENVDSTHLLLRWADADDEDLASELDGLGESAGVQARSFREQASPRKSAQVL
jgi:hypothetical protein